MAKVSKKKPLGRGLSSLLGENLNVDKLTNLNTNNNLSIIPRNVKISEAPSHGMPILMYDISCSGSQAYASLAAEIINQENKLNG